MLRQPGRHRRTLPAADGRPVSTAGEATGHYRLLLSLEQRFVGGMLTTDDFSPADSLVRYYNSSGTREKHAKALLFLGDVYRLVADNPSALKCYLQAGEDARREENPVLLEWTNQSVGDVYFEQGMYDECIRYYRLYHKISVDQNDSLRMAQAFMRMAKVFTIENQVDSILYCYRQAIMLSSSVKQANYIVPLAKSSLADVLIQTEDYDKAASLMPHDTLNVYNWAYWHLQQNHVDSAAYYFLQAIGRFGLQVDAECTKALANIEHERGDYPSACHYFNQLSILEDSLKESSQVEETRRTSAQYNYRLISEERDTLAKDKRQLVWFIIAVFISFVIIMFVILFQARKFKERKEAEITKERLLRMEKENILKRNEDEKRQVDEKIRQLKVLLEEAQRKNDSQQAEALSRESEHLAARKEHLVAQSHYRQMMEDEFKESRLYKLLHHQISNEAYSLSDDEWQQLADSVDSMSDHFTSRITSLAKLSVLELRICYLLKAGVSPIDMSHLLYREKSSVTRARSRMWTKLTGEPGDSQKLDCFIRDF